MTSLRRTGGGASDGTGPSAVQEMRIGGRSFVLLSKSDYKRLEEEARRGRDDASQFGGKAVGPDLRIRRRRARLTLSDVSSAAGIRIETLSRIENCRQNPTMRTVQAVLRALEVLSVKGAARGEDIQQNRMEASPYPNGQLV